MIQQANSNGTDPVLSQWAYGLAYETPDDTAAARRLIETAIDLGRPLEPPHALNLIREARAAIDREREAREAAFPYVIRWRNALLSSDAPSTRRWVLVALSLYARKDGTGAHPSQRRLAADTGLSERVVRDHLQEAEAEGWIRREIGGTGRAWRHHRYTLTLPADVGNEVPLDNRGESDARRGEPRSPKR